MESIYRFTSFQSFVEMVQSQCITLVKPCSWEDTYEGYMYQYITDDKFDRFSSAVAELGLEGKIETQLLKNYSQHVYGQCWSKVAESDALWRIYAYGKNAIRLEIKRSDIAKLYKVYALDVKYLDSINLKDEIKSTFHYQKLKNSPISLKGIDGITTGSSELTGLNITRYSQPFTTKRKAFEHEQEVRLLHFVDTSFQEYPESVYKAATREEKQKVLEELYRKQSISRETYEYIKLNYDLNVIRISFAEVSRFIKSVQLHPQADVWVDKMLQKYCQLNNIPYLGRSALYQKP